MFNRRLILQPIVHIPYNIRCQHSHIPKKRKSNYYSGGTSFLKIKILIYKNTIMYNAVSQTNQKLMTPKKSEVESS